MLCGEHELPARDGIVACMSASLSDYESVSDWVSRRLDEEHACYMHQNELAANRLRDEGVEDIAYRDYEERGFFDPTLYFAFEDFEAVLWGKDWWRPSWAETWRNRTFWHFLQWMYVE